MRREIENECEMKGREILCVSSYKCVNIAHIFEADLKSIKPLSVFLYQSINEGEFKLESRRMFLDAYHLYKLRFSLLIDSLKLLASRMSWQA